MRRIGTSLKWRDNSEAGGSAIRSILLAYLQYPARSGVIKYQCQKILGGSYEIGIVVGCRRGMRAGARRAGVGSGGQDRHSERSVRRLCRLWRQMVVRGRQDGGGGFWRQCAR